MRMEKDCTVNARTNQGASATESKSQTFKVPRCTVASRFRCRCQASRAQLRARWWALSPVRAAAAGKSGTVGRCERGAHSPCAHPSRASRCARYERMRLSGLFLLPYQPIYRSQPSLSNWTSIATLPSPPTTSTRSTPAPVVGRPLTPAAAGAPQLHARQAAAAAAAAAFPVTAVRPGHRRGHPFEQRPAGAGRRPATEQPQTTAGERCGAGWRGGTQPP